ncbi:MAG: hypothetical protein IKT46_00670 [Clostridia bacterium]|nr:hypothetical protein [Clostridia bacterium]
MLENEIQSGEVHSAQTPAAGETRVSFDELIEGDYRDEYKAKVEAIVKSRLKSHAEDKRRYEELSAGLGELAIELGIEADKPADIIESLKKHREEDIGQAGEAFSQENKDLSQPCIAPEVAQRVKELAMRTEEVKQLYPGLDIAKELSDPVFVQLMSASGGDVRRAYEMKYHDDILTHAMQYAFNTAEQRLSEAMASRVNRPGESAASGMSGVLMTRDPKNLTRAQRSEIKKRVRRGEKILW